MGAHSLNKKVIFVLGCIISLVFVFQNCSGVGFNNSGNVNNSGNNGLGNGNNQDDLGDLPPFCSDPNFSGECLFLFDTFDRDTILGNPNDPNTPFNWISVIDDVQREDYANIHATIYQNDEYELGEARHENHAVYVTGRPGSSVHDVFFISIPLDMSNYNEMRIQFSYLPVDLERWQWHGTGLEHIRLELCTGTLSQCGVNNSGGVNSGINSGHWQPIFTQPGFEANNANGSMSNTERGVGNNGRNHVASDWLEANSGNLNLNDSSLIRNKSQVLFRIAIMLDEGFTQNNNGRPDPNSSIEDAIGLDFVRVIARP